MPISRPTSRSEWPPVDERSGGFLAGAGRGFDGLACGVVRLPDRSNELGDRRRRDDGDVDRPDLGVVDIEQEGDRLPNVLLDLVEAPALGEGIR
jgi:hypothetical protein